MLAGVADTGQFLLLVVMVVAAIAKFAGFREFTEVATSLAAMLRIAARPVHPAIAGAVPFTELTAGTLLAVEPRLGAAACVVLLLIFTTVATVAVSSGHRVSCSCFGAMSSATLGPITIVRNVCLMGTAILVLIGSGSGRGVALPYALLGSLLGVTLILAESTVLHGWPSAPRLEGGTA